MPSWLVIGCALLLCAVAAGSEHDSRQRCFVRPDQLRSFAEEIPHEFLGLRPGDDRTAELWRRLNRRPCSGDSGSGKVFGLGLSKTATRSLAAALDALGLRVAHGLHLPPLLLTAESGPRKTAALVDLLASRRLDGAVDLPVPYWAAELLAAYPDARFVLTFRRVSDWLPSIREWYSRPLAGRERDTLVNRNLVYGSERYLTGVYQKAYIRHYIAMLETIPCCQLLWFNVWAGDGYPALADFLGIDRQRVAHLDYPLELHALDRAARRANATLSF